MEGMAGAADGRPGRAGPGRPEERRAGRAHRYHADADGMLRPADPGGHPGPIAAPHLSGAASPRDHRDFVRTECYAAFDMPNRTFGDDVPRPPLELVVYHGLGVGELYDLEADPEELVSLWDSPEHQAVKTDLLVKSYDANIAAMPYGPPLVMPYCRGGMSRHTTARTRGVAIWS